MLSVFRRDRQRGQQAYQLRAPSLRQPDNQPASQVGTFCYGARAAQNRAGAMRLNVLILAFYNLQ